MSAEFTEEEKAFFKSLKDKKPKCRLVFIFILMALMLVLLLDALNSSNVFKSRMEVYVGVAGLLLLGVFYLVRERRN